MPKIEIDGEFIIKRYGNGPVSKARFFRELRGLQRLQAFPFVPRLVSWVNGSLKLEKIDGDFIHHIDNPSSDVIKNLESILRRMHREWVFHLDLRQRKNILITKDRGVYLIDFESCIILPRCGIMRPLSEFLALLDTAGLLRVKSRYFSGSLTWKEKRFLRCFNKLRVLWFIRPFKRRKGDI